MMIKLFSIIGKFMRENKIIIQCLGIVIIFFILFYSYQICRVCYINYEAKSLFHSITNSTDAAYKNSRDDFLESNDFMRSFLTNYKPNDWKDSLTKEILFARYYERERFILIDNCYNNFIISSTNIFNNNNAEFCFNKFINSDIFKESPLKIDVRGCFLKEILFKFNTSNSLYLKYILNYLRIYYSRDSSFQFLITNLYQTCNDVETKIAIARFIATINTKYSSDFLIGMLSSNNIALKCELIGQLSLFNNSDSYHALYEILKSNKSMLIRSTAVSSIIYGKFPNSNKIDSITICAEDNSNEIKTACLEAALTNYNHELNDIYCKLWNSTDVSKMEDDYKIKILVLAGPVISKWDNEFALDFIKKFIANPGGFIIPIAMDVAINANQININKEAEEMLYVDNLDVVRRAFIYLLYKEDDGIKIIGKNYLLLPEDNRRVICTVKPWVPKNRIEQYFNMLKIFYEKEQSVNLKYLIKKEIDK